MKTLGCEKDTIKEVELEDYVAMVVASEIGNAPLEACKAQAVAARSYAIAAGVLNNKVISDNSSTAQACRFSRSNYVIPNQAAQLTAGEVLTYNNKVISSVYTSSNGGRTYSSEEVWGGYRPYLISKPDAWTTAAGYVKKGHGVGMSQVGAIYAAQHNLSYEDILSFYYPNTTLEVKYADNSDEDYNRKILEEVKIRVQLALNTLKEGLE